MKSKADKRYISLFFEELKDKIKKQFNKLSKYNKYLDLEEDYEAIKFRKLMFLDDFIMDLTEWETNEYSLKKYLEHLYQKTNDERREIVREIYILERAGATDTLLFRFYHNIDSVLKEKMIFIEKIISYIEKGGEEQL